MSDKKDTSMSDEKEWLAIVKILNDAIEPVLSSQIDLAKDIGVIKGEISGINAQLKGMEGRLQVGSSQMHDTGTLATMSASQIVSLQKQIDDAVQDSHNNLIAVEAETKRILDRHSGELQSLGSRTQKSSEYVSQIITIDQTRKKDFSMLIKIISVLIAVAGAVGVSKYIDRCSSSAPRHINLDARR